MNPVQTVVFADIVGSTALFDTLGNARAAAAVTALTQWIGESMQTHGGQVVKTLGDGVLGRFADPSAAVAAMVAVMRTHREAMAARPDGLRQSIRVGLARGELVEVAGDCFGDAVNVAARLCERAGADEIWATAAALQQVGAVAGTQFIRLGPLEMRGKADPLVLFQVAWREDLESDSLTQQAALPSRLASLGTEAAGAVPLQMQLSWPGQVRRFAVPELPLQIGRSTDAAVCLADPRVSRLHARIEARQGTLVLTDLSSFGTWVRFDGSDTVVALRRDSCLLHGAGLMALGGPPNGPGTPTVRFRVAGPAAVGEGPG